MMIDQDIAYCSASTVYRVLKSAGYLSRFNDKPSGKGRGFEQPLRAHEQWHTDISYINMLGTFYYFIAVLDGYSRSIIHWDLRERMTEQDVEIVIQAACEKHPAQRPNLITDNGSQYTAKDFKEFIRVKGLNQIRTSIAYPQSNGKMERFNKTLKSECVRRKALLDFDTAKSIMGDFIDYYNSERLHSSLNYTTPFDRLHGRDENVLSERFRKLERAREERKERNQFTFSERKVNDLQCALAMKSSA